MNEEIEGDHSNASPVSPISEDLPHKPADDSEQVFFEGSPVMRGAVGRNLEWELLGVLFLILPLAIEWFVHSHVPAIWLVGLVIVGLIICCIPPLRALTVKYRVTNYRIDYERGLISKDINTLELWHIEDIHYHQTFRDRLLGIGTIKVISHDTLVPNLEMHSLPHSRELFDRMKKQIISVKRQRGVLKLDSGT